MHFDEAVQRALFSTVAEQFNSLWLPLLTLLSIGLRKLLYKVLFESIEARLKVLFFRFVLGDEVIEVVFDPDLMIVNHVALF